MFVIPIITDELDKLMFGNCEHCGHRKSDHTDNETPTEITFYYRDIVLPLIGEPYPRWLICRVIDKTDPEYIKEQKEMGKMIDDLIRPLKDMAEQFDQLKNV